LDFVEFIINVEQTFDLAIPDQAAQDLDTPRRLIHYLAERLHAATPGLCLSQRAFYQLRRSLCQKLGLRRSSLRPNTDLLAVLPGEGRGQLWQSVGQDVGAGNGWPRLAKRGPWPCWYSSGIKRLGEAAQFLADQQPRQGGHWTRAQVAQVVHRLIQEEFGLARGSYRDNTTWRDMGID
jgi:hypothetical protein